PRPDHEIRPTGPRPTSPRRGAPTMSATVSFKVTTPHGPHTVTLSHTRAGRGEPLLLLHGIGHHRQAWDPVVDILATEREVIAVDLPGFGASPTLPEDRKSTRLNSSHVKISYAVFCLKKKKKTGRDSN